MRKKIIITIIFSFIFILGILTYIIINKNNKEYENSNYAIDDECIKEEYMYEMGMFNDEIEVSSAEEKLSPNAKFIIKKKYNGCGHIVEEIAELPNEMVNRNQEEIEKMYNEVELESFNKNEIVFFKQVEGICNEHYKIKEENGLIVVYTINEKGTESIYEKTNISTKYLPENDLQQIRNELIIYGKKNLNKFIEDFE